jgi:hypothetical protein
VRPRAEAAWVSISTLKLLALILGHLGQSAYIAPLLNRGQRSTAGGRRDGFVQRFMVTPRLTVFLQADVAIAAAQGAVGRCPGRYAPVPG